MREEFVIPAFAGLNRNQADRAEGEVPNPDEVYNLWPYSQGGLQFFGGAVDLAGTSNVIDGNTKDQIGKDESGLASFQTTATKIPELWLENSLITSTGFVATAGSFENRLHVPTLGVLAAWNDAFLLGDVENVDQEGQPGYAFTYTSSPTGGLITVSNQDSIYLHVITYKVLANGTKFLVDHDGTVFNFTTATANVSIGVTFPPVASGEIVNLYTQRFREAGKLCKLFVNAAHKGTATATATYTTAASDTTFLTKSGTGNFFLGSHGVTIVEHNRRYWGRIDTIDQPFQVFHPRAEVPSDASSPLTLAFSEQEWLNLFDPDYKLVMPAIASDSINHVIGSNSNQFGEFGGVVVFCDNETFVVRGDPAIPTSVEVERFPVDIGADSGVKPVQIGDTIYVVWDGELYVVRGTQAEKISGPILESDENITDIAADPKNRSIVVETDITNGSIGVRYRYFYEYQFWMRDVEPTDWTTSDLGPASLISGTGGMYYWFEAGNATVPTGSIWQVSRTSTDGGTPALVYRDIDFGDPARRDSLQDMSLFVSDWKTITATSADAPRIYYDYGPDTDVETDTGNTDYVIARKTAADHFYYTLPLRRKANKMDVRIRLDGMGLSATLAAPMYMGFVRGYRKRS